MFLGKVGVDSGSVPDAYLEFLPGINLGQVYDKQYLVNTNVSPLPIPVLHRGPTKESEVHLETIHDLDLVVEDTFVSNEDGYIFVRRKVFYTYNNNEVSSFLYAYAKT